MMCILSPPNIKSIYRIFLISLFLFTGYFASAQSNPLEKCATLRVQKQPLEQVLDTVTKQTGVRFSYDSQIINPKTKITINAQNKTVKEILSKILPSSVSYKKVGEHIVFYSNSGKSANDCLNGKSVAEDTINLEDNISLTKEEEEMKSQVAGIMMAVAATSVQVAAQETQVIEQNTQTVEKQIVVQDTSVTQDAEIVAKTKPFQLTFIYPLGTGFVNTAENAYHFSINVLGGVTGQNKGFEAGSIFNINKYGATGAQFAGIFNLTNANNPEINSNNAQFAGIFNHTQQGKSAQFAGIFNKGDTASIQAGGIFNIAHKAGCQLAGIFNYGDTAGFQAAGVCNVTAQTPCQVAGIANIASKTVFQAAGIVNIAYQGATCQMADIANIAQESVCQIAGIVNVTKKGRFQMGLVNIRDTADGVSLGLINIVKKGGIMEAGIEAGEFIHTAATFRSGVQRLYSIFSYGCNYTEKFLTLGGGLGTSFKLKGNLGLNLELTYASLYNIDIFGWYSHTQFKPVLNYRFAKHFKIYVGPSFNLTNQNDWLKDGANHPPRTVKVPYSLYNRTINHSTLDMWVGIVGGIKF